MKNAPPARLFRPGDGALPPALTGRGVQQGVLSRCLGDLVAGVAPPHNVVLLGPRGNGKTVLLQWFRAACAERSVAVEALTPHCIAGHEALADALTPRRGIARWLPRRVGVASAGSAEWRSAAPVRQDLIRALIARCRKKPLAVLLDEAHTLAPDVGGALLNASQQVRADAPFLLVLAGTPGLPDRLSAMDASLLVAAGQGTAARRPPGRRSGSRSTGSAAGGPSRRVREGCPGRRHRAQPAVSLLHPVVGRRTVGAPRGHRRRAHHHRRRRRRQARCRRQRGRLLSDPVSGAAGRWTARRRGGGRAALPDLRGRDRRRAREAALAGTVAGDEAGRFAVLAKLNRLGFVWRPPGQASPAVWSAGIPSLTTYVLEHATRVEDPPGAVWPEGGGRGTAG